MNMNKKHYIKRLTIGKVYKTKHYRRWLIYLGRYKTYTPFQGFCSYYAFIKQRQGKPEFILYKSLHKLIHLEKANEKVGKKERRKYIETLKTYLPPMSLSSVIDFELVGDEIKLNELPIPMNPEGRERLVEYHFVHAKQDQNWLRMSINREYLFKINPKKPKLLLRPYATKVYSIRLLGTITIKEGIIEREDYDHEFKYLKEFPEDVYTYPEHIYRNVIGIQIKFENGETRTFKYKFTPYTGMLKINEVLIR